jgi:polysaccharide export outer membrane protein
MRAILQGKTIGFVCWANLDGVYVVKPNGRVATKKRNIFGIKRQPKLMAGDTIVVPLNTQYRDSLPLWRDVTAIIYQTVVSLAALAAI